MIEAKEEAKKLLVSFKDILKKPEMQILPGQIAFYFIMSIIPIIAICTIIASYITKSFNFMETVNSVLPPVFANILTSLTTNMQIEGIAFVLILYLLIGSNAPASIMTASNVLYDIKQPKYLNLKAKAFFMTVVIVMLLLFVVIIPLFGDIIVNFLTEVFDINFLKNYRWLYVIIKAVVSFIIMFYVIRLLYTMAPNKKIDRRTTVKGSLFTSIGWILATYIFAFYITNIASYNVVYGNFANVLILLLWVYFLAYLFVVGMALNVDEFHKKRMCNDVKNKETKEKSKTKKETKE